MPWCCEPCFLIKDPKLLFPGMGCFPHVPDPVLRVDVPSLRMWKGVCAGGGWCHPWAVCLAGTMASLVALAWPSPQQPLLLLWAVTAAHSLETHCKDNLDRHIDQINILQNTDTLFIGSCYFTPNKKVL